MKKRIIGLFLLAASLLCACQNQTAEPTTGTTTASSTTSVATTVPTQPTVPTTTAPLQGFQTQDGLRYYYIDGQKHTGWLTLEDDRYFFAEDGQMHTGWLEDGEDKYYFLPDGRMAKGQVVLDEGTFYFASTGKYVLIVNFRNMVAQDYMPTLESWRGIKLEPQTMAAVQAMILDGEAMGHKFWLNSAYRSWTNQQSIWDKRYNQYISEGMTPEAATQKVSQSVARPGTSEHHTGMAVDIDGTWESLGWMAENSWRYGLIVRYPEGKTDYTGVIYEPWHFRYVGVELAQELYESGLCMEEYMENLTLQQGREFV